jgi:hypothetical protein
MAATYTRPAAHARVTCPHKLEHLFFVAHAAAEKSK